MKVKEIAPIIALSLLSVEGLKAQEVTPTMTNKVDTIVSDTSKKVLQFEDLSIEKKKEILNAEFDSLLIQINEGEQYIKTLEQKMKGKEKEKEFISYADGKRAMFEQIKNGISGAKQSINNEKKVDESPYKNMSPKLREKIEKRDKEKNRQKMIAQIESLKASIEKNKKENSEKISKALKDLEAIFEKLNQ